MTYKITYARHIDYAGLIEEWATRAEELAEHDYGLVDASTIERAIPRLFVQATEEEIGVIMGRYIHMQIPLGKWAGLCNGSKLPRNSESLYDFVQHTIDMVVQDICDKLDERGE